MKGNYQIKHVLDHDPKSWRMGKQPPAARNERKK
jgi:hypothetical protein